MKDIYIVFGTHEIRDRNLGLAVPEEFVTVVNDKNEVLIRVADAASPVSNVTISKIFKFSPAGNGNLWIMGVNYVNGKFSLDYIP